jgi:hypothetical protein
MDTKDNKYGDLRKKTVIYFCDKCPMYGGGDLYFYTEREKNKMIKYYRKNQPANAAALLCYAGLYDDMELKRVVEKEFANELEYLNNKYGDLRKKTVFDFCEDYDSVYEKIYDVTPLSKEGKERKLRLYSEDATKNASAMIEYAEFVGDIEFQRVIEKEFFYELDSLFNE